MPRARPPYLHRETTRHGKVVWVVRRDHGTRVRLHAEYGSQAFWQEYQAALAGTPTEPKKPTSPKKSTLAWAIARYRLSSAWAALKPATRKQRENIFRAVIATAGDEKLSDITAATIREGRERRAATPHSANNFLKAMRGLFGWALEHEFVTVDPTKGVSLLAGANDDVGFHTWTEEEVKRFEDRWPLGTRERLALDIFLFTGLRRGDAVRLGRQHIRDGVIFFPRTEKTGADVILPLLPPLAASIAATQTGDLTFLVTGQGLPFVKESFGNWFRDVCRKTGVPGSAHGLRKAGAVRAAENGATESQLKAMYGWADGKMAARYTKAADQKRLAMAGAKHLLPAQSQNENRPHLGSGEGDTAEKLGKTGG